VWNVDWTGLAGVDGGVVLPIETTGSSLMLSILTETPLTIYLIFRRMVEFLPDHDVGVAGWTSVSRVLRPEVPFRFL
jgi:hypothetical protein